MHYLPQDVRGKVMREVPAAYNAYCGREVVLTRVAEPASMPEISIDEANEEVRASCEDSQENWREINASIEREVHARRLKVAFAYMIAKAIAEYDNAAPPDTSEDLRLADECIDKIRRIIA